MIGISLYPDKSTKALDQQYLQQAYQLGYRMVFMSFLQINIKDPKYSIQRIQESCKLARSMGFLITMDIHPLVFQYCPCSSEDLAYFHDMGVTTLRLDTGIDGKTEAMMSRNPYGIHIEINMSNDTHMLESIMDYHPDTKRLSGSHNFYPQRYTGLSIEAFTRGCLHFQQYHLQSAAFVTSHDAQITPWPIDEGLCTLEDHRDLPLEVQARHMKMMGLVDTIIIANAYASEAELLAMSEVEKSDLDVLHVEFYDDASSFEKAIVTSNEHEYRGDASAYVIRSSKGRRKYQKDAIPPHTQARDIHKGDILLLNDEYMQYKGELQIALTDRKKDAKINVVAHVVRDEQVLVDTLRPFQKFLLKEIAS